MPTRPHIATPSDAQRLATESKRKEASARELDAERAHVRELTGRLKRTERAIRALITSKELTDAQREEFLGLLTGARAGDIEPKPAGSSPHEQRQEQRLVENYRLLTIHGKGIVARVAAELAELARRRAEEKKGRG